MAFDSDNYNPDASPKRCSACHSQEFKDVVKSEIQGQVLEYSVQCNYCHAPVAYWAHGHFDPAYARGFL